MKHFNLLVLLWIVVLVGMIYGVIEIRKKWPSMKDADKICLTMVLCSSLMLAHRNSFEKK